MSSSDYQQDIKNIEEIEKESKDENVNQLYKGLNLERKEPFPLRRIHQAKARDDKATIQANRKLKQIRLKGFLQPNQPNPFISLLNLQIAPMACNKFPLL
jgi:hypothetical protein